ncbi:MAG TPA: uracil-DNA glycosylase family protein [Ferruginibacter sp.]|nr:uracil-DNA glycosylase family protein [Ferruginibacter sp.]
MAVKYSLDLIPKINCKSNTCKACGLYLNQLPVFDKAKKSNIFWVGLSAVLFDDGIEKQPLSPATRSGNLITQIEQGFMKNNSFYKTNLIKCVPLKDNKIRYPFEHEMEKCFPNFEVELKLLKPSVVFLLGKQVATFVLKKLSISEFALDENFNYSAFTINNIQFIPIHHPSYILVYKRKFIPQYMDAIQALFSTAAMPHKKIA